MEIPAYTRSLENAEDWADAKMEGAIKKEQGKAISDFFQAGNALYPYQQSGHISLHSKNCREVMGGVYLGHSPLRTFGVKVINREHPSPRECNISW
jgi:hypothetical protein